MTTQTTPTITPTAPRRGRSAGRDSRTSVGGTGRRSPLPVKLSLLVVPNYVAFVPIIKLYASVHLNGTFPAAWLAHIGFAMSLAIYILRNYMATLPKDVVESAKIDGASHFQTFYRLILPMSAPA